MHDHFDVNQGDASPSAPDPIRGMLHADLDERIREVTGRIADISARIAEQEEAEDLDPDIERRLVTLTSGDEAPLEYRSLAGQVERGTLTWKQFWIRPQDHGKAGVRLTGEVLSQSVAAQQAQIAALVSSADEREDTERRAESKDRGKPEGPGQRGGRPGAR